VFYPFQSHLLKIIGEVPYLCVFSKPEPKQQTPANLAGVEY
jgi:hypothetical protein